MNTILNKTLAWLTRISILCACAGLFAGIYTHDIELILLSAGYAGTALLLMWLIEEEG